MTSHVVCEFEGVVGLTFVVADQTRIVPEVPAWRTWKQQYQKLVDCCTMPHCRLHVSRSPCDRKPQRKRCCQSAVSALLNRCGGICCPVVVHWIGTVVSRFGNHCAIGGATSEHEGEMLLLGVTSRISSACSPRRWLSGYVRAAETFYAPTRDRVLFGVSSQWDHIVVEFFPAESEGHGHESCTLWTQWRRPTSKCCGG